MQDPVNDATITLFRGLQEDNEMIYKARYYIVLSITIATILFTGVCPVHADDSGSGSSDQDKAGIEDALSFDYDEDLKLAGEDDPAPEDGDGEGEEEEPSEPVEPVEPQPPISFWPGIQMDNTSPVLFMRTASGKKIEYRKLSKQKMYGYDTFQGACAHGKFSYHVLFNRNKQKCKIIKVRISNNKVVKKSKPLPLDHGNDLTYDSKRGRILCIHYGKHSRRISVIHPKTLKVLYYKDIKTPKKRLPGASTAFSKAIKGVTGIAYDKNTDEFICSIKGTRHFLVLNSDLNPVRVIKVPKLDPYMRQGFTVYKGFIVRAFSAEKKPYDENIIYIYDYDGNYIKSIRLGKGFEIESVYFVGDKLYASTYHSYFKKVKKRVKKLVKVKVKTKKIDPKTGKHIYKIKRKKKKVKVTVYVLRRDNNIIQIPEY